MYLGLLVLVVVALFVYKCRNGGKFTVYGTDWCGYTTKMRRFIDRKFGSGSHTYKNCDNGECPQGIDGFPVTVNNETGKVVTGYNTNI
jgi:hypothetical protein